MSAAIVARCALLIDVGNTRIKLGLFEKGAFHYLGAMPTQLQSAGFDKDEAINEDINEDINEAINTQMHFFWDKHPDVLDRVERIIAVCVAGAEAARQVQAALGDGDENIAIEWLTGQTPLHGLHNDYATPHTLGADRWLAIYGVLQLQTDHTPIVLATLGTATTVDVLYWQNGQAHFAGGLIMAGLLSSWQTLSRSTAQLPDMSIGESTDTDTVVLPIAVIPNTTQTALLQGAIFAQAGGINLLVAHVTQHYGTPKLYIAGGAAVRVAGYLNGAHDLDYPVLIGLAAYAAVAS
jgi:type III pantothenate kinase